MSAPELDVGVQLVELVEASRPDIVRLAELVSLAVRIEPALLRCARIKDEPMLPVETEADLWFSPLVRSYSPRALVLHPEAAAVLRARLNLDPPRRERSHRIVTRLHQHAAPTIRLEEAVLYAALTGRDVRQIDALLASVLNTMNEVPRRADAMARWAARALPTLPEVARTTDSARKLDAGARRRLQSSVDIGIELMSAGIVVGHPPAAASHVVSLPADQLELKIRAARPDAPVRTITVRLEKTDEIDVPRRRRAPAGVDIETPDGRVLELRPVEQSPGRALDLSDLQGGILRAYGNDYDHTSYVFVRLDTQPGIARTWFAGLLAHVTTAEPWIEGKPTTTLNVAVTAAGLAALGVPPDVLGSFSYEFQTGMAARAERLGDVGGSDPATWDPGLGTGDAHVLLTIAAQEREDLSRALVKMRSAMEAGDGIRIVHQEHTQALRGAREHFGFADGFAQPAIEGATDFKAPGGGVPLSGGRWRALAPGEFILGYPDEHAREDPLQRLPKAPGDPLGRSGTYMVWRKLYQDVALWRRVLRDASKLYHGGSELKLSAAIVGRWPDGTPLVTSPDGPDPRFDPAARGANDFRYSDDLDGRRCPLGAHIRRANPRDALGFDGVLTSRHRMIRRGMPYGPPLEEGVMTDDGADRGLVFVSFQTSISRQFEAVQMQWLNDGNIFGLGHDRDFLLGSPDGMGKMTIQGEPPFFLSPMEAFVKTRGGEYLFVPGISALAAIADGTAR